VRESNVGSIKVIRWKRQVKIFCLFTNMFILGLFIFFLTTQEQNFLVGEIQDGVI
jgi:hypothetical protein